MSRALLLPNPSASRFTGGAFRAVTAALSERFELETSWPASPSEATHLSRAAVVDGYDVVVAMGGDGVVHHVANGLAYSDVALGIVPAGTTNVLARILGIPASSEKAARALADYPRRTTTLASVTASTPKGPRTRHAVFSLGVGFDADVVGRAEQTPHSKLYLGSLHYARSALEKVFGDYRTRAPTMEVRCGGETVRAVAVMVQIHDRYTYFGRIPMHLGSNGEGRLTAVAIEAIDGRRALGLLRHSLLRNGLERARGCTTFRDFDRLVIEADPAPGHQADGEHLGVATDFEISPARDALTIMAPAGDDEGENG